MSALENLRNDPGQVFASDEHRRVLASLPDNAHVASDDRNDFTSFDEVAAHARKVNRLGKNVVPPTSRSLLDLLRWINRHDPHLQHLEPTAVEEVLTDLEADGFVASSDGEWSMTRRGYDALNGPNGVEPPPLEGRRLEAAQLQDEALREEVAGAEDEERPVVDFTGDEEAN